jgi:hypothetical protein
MGYSVFMTLQVVNESTNKSRLGLQAAFSLLVRLHFVSTL